MSQHDRLSLLSDRAATVAECPSMTDFIHCQSIQRVQSRKPVSFPGVSVKMTLILKSRSSVLSSAFGWECMGRHLANNCRLALLLVLRISQNKKILNPDSECPRMADFLHCQTEPMEAQTVPA